MREAEAMASNLDRPRLYRADGQRRWERLKAEMVASGAVASEQLDFSPDSLRMVWQYVLPRLRKRPQDEPVEPARQPPWWDGPRWRRYAAWDDATHDLIGGVSYYFGEVRVRRPGAAWTVGLPETYDEGEPVIEGDQVHLNPLGMVLNALAEAADGRPDPESLVRLARYVSEPQPLELLYSTRLVLRLRGTSAGLLRRRSSLDASRISEAVGRLLQIDPVNVLPAGQTVFEHIGSGDWRARLEVDAASGGVREVRAVIGAPWNERPGPGRAEQVREFVDALLRLGAEIGGGVDILRAQPSELDAPRPSGLLTPDRVPAVLEAVELGPRRRRRR